MHKSIRLLVCTAIMASPILTAYAQPGMGGHAGTGIFGSSPKSMTAGGSFGGPGKGLNVTHNSNSLAVPSLGSGTTASGSVAGGGIPSSANANTNGAAGGAEVSVSGK